MGKHSSALAPAQTPAEVQAGQSAQPYLQEYNSGVLNPANQAAVNLQDTNATGANLQELANQGMLGSSAQGLIVGTVSKATPSASMQAGAGSIVDLQKLSTTQAILASDLKIANDYLQISGGEASSLAADQQEQAGLLAQSLGSTANAIGDILGDEGQKPEGADMSLDPNAPYYGPGTTNPNADLDQLLND